MSRLGGYDVGQGSSSAEGREIVEPLSTTCGGRCMQSPSKLKAASVDDRSILGSRPRPVLFVAFKRFVRMKLNFGRRVTSSITDVLLIPPLFFPG